MTCTSCGAAIIWARTRTGKRMPLDAAPSPGTALLSSEGNVRIVPEGEGTHVVHWATCPNASKHRKDKRRQ